MLRTYLDCVLRAPSKMKARVSICPTGVIKIELADKNTCYSCELEKICFEQNGKTICLVGCSYNEQEPWRLNLNKEDARELKKRIDEMQDMVEILMRDLA